MLLDLEQFKSHWANTFPSIAKQNTHFLIAVSGGVDSIVLAFLMQQMGAKCSIAHANFQLRGEESSRDENFVQAFAAKMGMPFLTKRFDTLAFAEQYKMGIQQAAREIRYAWFETLVKELNSTADDVLVTPKDLENLTSLIIKNIGNFSQDEFEKKFEVFSVLDGEILFMRNFLSSEEAQKIYEVLQTTINWKQEQITIFGNTRPVVKCSTVERVA